MKKTIRIVIIIVVILIVIIMMAGVGKVSDDDALEGLKAAPVSTLAPTGELADIYAFGTDYTDIQRENKLKEIKGSVVAWQLPVYEVKREGEDYRIQTINPTAMGKQETLVSAIITLTALSPEDRTLIESLKTGDIISFKGVIKDVRLRHMIISPAYLFTQTSKSSSLAETHTPVAEPSISSDEDPVVSEVDSQQFSEEIKLRNGVIAIDEYGTVFLNSKELEDASGMSVGGLNFTAHWKAGDSDVVLIKSGCRVEDCGMKDQYQLVTLHKNGTPTVSASFGNGLEPVITHNNGVMNLAFGDSIVTVENSIVVIPNELKL